MTNRIHLLQEDLRWQEEFIDEIAKYDRELANNILVAISEGDENMIILLQQSGLLEEGIGTAMERGAELGQRANNAVGLSGKVSKFFLLDKPAKAAGAAIGGAAHLLGKDVGGSRSGGKKEDGAEEPKEPTAPKSGGDDSGSAKSSTPPAVNVNVSQNASPNINVSPSMSNVSKNKNINNGGAGRDGADGKDGAVGPQGPAGADGKDATAPMARVSGSGSKPVSPESATKDALTKIDGLRSGLNKMKVASTVKGMAPGTQGRTETNVDAASTSGDAPKIAAATEPKLSLRNRIGNAVMGVGDKLRSMTKKTPQAKLDPNRPMTGADNARVAKATVGREATTTAIKNADQRAARATVGRSATNIAARTGAKTSPETVAKATETTGQMRDTGIEPRKAAQELTGTLTKYGPNSGSAATLRRLATPQGPTIDRDTLKAAVSGRNRAQLPAAETKKEVPNALAGLRRGRRGGTPSRMTAKGREEMSNQQARKVDPNKGAAGDQMDFGNMYRAADSRRKVAAVRSRGRL